MVYNFGSESLRCVVDTIGAELVSVKLNGKERLWQNDNGSWSGHAPVLFPFAGHCVVKKEGVNYSIPRHGVARRQPFALVSITESEATFVLRANDETKAMYPFDFSLYITYVVEGNSIKVIYRVVNEGEETMYAAFGSHESYALDGEVDEYEAVFEQEEDFTSLVTHPEDGRLLAETKSYGKGTHLPFPKQELNNTVVLKGVNSRVVYLKKIGEEAPLAKLTYNGFSNMLFWHPKESRMVCMEPWQNLPDVYGVEKEISENSWLNAIEPKAEYTVEHEIEYF